jgi:hypothetical protein
MPGRYLVTQTPVLPQKDRHEHHVHEWRRREPDRLEREWAANRAAYERLQDAAEWIAQGCRDGVITSYARPETGGQLSELSASDWNVEDVLMTFMSKGGFLSARGVPRIGRIVEGRNFIFLERAELMAAIEKLVPVPPIKSSYEQVVKWCTTWRAESRGSQNAAWDAFKVLPEHTGHKRHSFREAWAEAGRQKSP